MKLTIFTALLLLSSLTALHAAELRFAGTLGNSDDSQPVFAGKLAAGIGPVLDDDGTLWERGGKHPERVFAWIAFKSAFGKQFSEPAIYPIPGLVLSGENDRSYFQDQLETVKKLRKENHARMHMIVEPGGGHWGEGPRGTKTLPILMAFIRTAYHLRVPADADPSKGPPRLIDAGEEKGWLGKNLDGVRVRDQKFQWSWKKPVVVRQLLEIAPHGQFAGDKSEASWLPGEEYARKWREFCHTGMLKSQ